MMDAEARFRALFESAYPLLHRYALHRGLSKQDADDLVASTLEIAWRRLADVPAEDPLPWLYAVARNLRRNETRSSARRTRLLSRLAPAPPAPAPDELAALGGPALRDALARLDEDDAELLRLVAWDGLSPSQAAVVLGCGATAARTRLHRARRRLATELAVEGSVQHRSAAQRRVGSGQTEGDTTQILSMEAPSG